MTTADDPTDVVGRRVGAHLIDSAVSLVWAVPSLVVGLVMGFKHGVRTAYDTEDAAVAGCQKMAETGMPWCFPSGTEVLTLSVPTFVVVVMAMTIPLTLILFVLLPSRTGWTPGKLACGIRVVNDTTFGPAGFWRQALRQLAWWVDHILPGLPVLVIVHKSKGHRRLGDMAARTLVVGKEHWKQPVPVPGVNDLPPLSPALPPPPGAPPDRPAP